VIGKLRDLLRHPLVESILVSAAAAAALGTLADVVSRRQEQLRELDAELVARRGELNRVLTRIGSARVRVATSATSSTRSAHPPFPGWVGPTDEVPPVPGVVGGERVEDLVDVDQPGS
jgi:hypothetical protein